MFSFSEGVWLGWVLRVGSFLVMMSGGRVSTTSFFLYFLPDFCLSVSWNWDFAVSSKTISQYICIMFSFICFPIFCVLYRSLHSVILWVSRVLLSLSRDLVIRSFLSSFLGFAWCFSFLETAWVLLCSVMLLSVGLFSIFSWVSLVGRKEGRTFFI